MKQLLEFLKTSLIGGLFVLLPLVLFYLLLSELLQVVVVLATPIADLFPKGTFDQVKMPVVIGIILIVGASFLFGLALRSASLRRLGFWIERTLLGRLPLYNAVKRMGRGLVGAQDETAFRTGVFSSSNGEKQSGEKAQGGGDLRSAVQNPISSLISLPFKFTFDYGAPNGEASFLNIQPVVPITVGNWNLVNRAIVPLIDSPGEIAGTPGIPNPIPGDGATGLGDINYSLYFSPVKYEKVIWGIGPSITIPTATDKELGSEKWSAGPTGVVLFQPKWGTFGMLARHLGSFAGDSDRKDVNQSLFEPFVNYNLPNGWYLITDIIITANWDLDSSDIWTVPLGGGVGKLFMIGNQAINARTEAYYNVEKPDSAPDWQWAFTVQFLFPK